jgi:hypothetical protein
MDTTDKTKPRRELLKKMYGINIKEWEIIPRKLAERELILLNLNGET